MHIGLVVNPVAGRRKWRRAAAGVTDVFEEAGWDVTAVRTLGPGNASERARECAEQGCDAVFAFGGDGTLSEVLSGLLDTAIPAGIIPAGTGNDFARTIGLPPDPVDAASCLVAGQPRDVDLLEVDEGRCWAVNVIGVGFDACVARRVNRRTRVIGGLPAYLACVGMELLWNRPTELRMCVDGETWEGLALLLAVANARSYGAGMLIAPHAEVDDGLLDVVLVEHMSRACFVTAFPRVMRGTHLSHPAVRCWRGREVTVETGDASPVLVDGDLKGDTPLSVRVAAGRGRLWLPYSGASEPTQETDDE